MRNAVLTVVTVAAVWIQVSFLAAWRPYGAVPDLLAVVLVAAAVALTATETAAIGLGGGLLLDLLSGADFGLRLAFYTFLALALVMVKRGGVALEQAAPQLLTVAAATLIFNVAVLAGIWHHLHPFSLVLGRVGAEMVLNGLILLAIRPLVRPWLERRGEMIITRSSEGRR